MAAQGASNQGQAGRTGHDGGHGGGHDHAHGGHHGSLKSYVIGYILSIVLTIIPIYVVLNDMLEGTAALLVLFGTAIFQFAVQLLFFMHLREEKQPRYNLMSLLFGLVILVTI